jgi:hypothetical protein
MKPNLHNEKSKQENRFRKRIAQWEILLPLLGYLSEVAWIDGKNFGHQVELKKNERHSKNKTLLETLVKNSKHPIKNQEAAKKWYIISKCLFLDDYVQQRQTQKCARNS